MTNIITNRKQPIIFMVGVSAMGLAGCFLIEGMSNFSAPGSSQFLLIFAGIMFQVTESICFMEAAIKNIWLGWRLVLFSLGSVLFVASIWLMTMAQNAIFADGNKEAKAITDRISSLNERQKHIDSIIEGYTQNAERQSKSIYANSRKLGQKSLDLAEKLDAKKEKIEREIFNLQTKLKQTSNGYFQKIENITGYSAQTSEMIFLIARSLLFELCGIILLAYSAYLNENHMRKSPQPTARKKKTTEQQKKPTVRKENQIENVEIEEQPNRNWAHSYFDKNNENKDLSPEEEVAKTKTEDNDTTELTNIEKNNGNKGLSAEEVVAKIKMEDNIKLTKRGIKNQFKIGSEKAGEVLALLREEGKG